jgi:hypothetical protein
MRGERIAGRVREEERRGEAEPSSTLRLQLSNLIQRANQVRWLFDLIPGNGAARIRQAVAETRHQ